MKILLSLALVFVFAFVGFGQIEPESTSKDTVTQMSSKAVENPEAAKIRNRGVDFYMENDNDAAIIEFTKAIEIDPNFADAYNRRGAAYANKRDHTQAIADYNKAIELNPKFATPYLNRAGSYMVEKSYQSAVDDYSKLIELNPPLAAVYYDLRADAYTAMKRKDLASADRKKAKELKKSGFVLNNF